MKTLVINFILVLLTTLALPIQAGTLVVPNSFSAGTPAIAAEVNGNFTAVQIEVNDNDSRITGNDSRITSNTSRVEVLEGFANSTPPVECTGLSFVQAIDDLGNVTCSTDLLGTGYSRRFPQVLDNLVELEIASVLITDPVLVISGIGWDTERIQGFDVLGRPADTPGLSMEHDFVIEAGGADATALINYFDNSLDNFRAMSVIIRDAFGSETFRINLFEYDHFSYVPSTDGRTRFTFVQSTAPDNIPHIHLDSNPGIDPFGTTGSNNPATDTNTEISGVTSFSFYPQVEIDEVNRTMALTYPIAEGNGLKTWSRNILSGIPDLRSGSVIQESGGVEVSRENYYGMFPLSWEIFDGFGLHDKIKARVVISFDFHEPG